jgi:hypothetical protein
LYETSIDLTVQNTVTITPARGRPGMGTYKIEKKTEIKLFIGKFESI